MRHTAAHLPRTLAKAEAVKELAHADSLFTDMKDLVANGRRVLQWAEAERTEGRGRLALWAIR